MALLTFYVRPVLGESKRGAKDTRESVHQKAMNAYESAQFSKAAELFEQEISLLAQSDIGRAVELEAREKWILSLYNAGKKDQAVAEYKTLRARYPSFRFNEDEVLPETVQYFDQHAGPSLVDQPRIVKGPGLSPTQPAQPWQWYYVAPLGVGQFLAGSPVRGVVFAVLEVGLVAANIALAVDYNSKVGANGGTRDVAGATTLQTAMNVTFFSAIGAFVAGTVDGIFFEP